jgi:hypothetical protein
MGPSFPAGHKHLCLRLRTDDARRGVAECS